MIPRNLKAYLKEHLPETAIKNRTIREKGRCFMEFGYMDEHLLYRMGINRDRLGPRLVVCMWDESSPLEVGGYLVVDNLAMGSPAMGGIRMLPDITPVDIHNLARGMTLKNAAADLPYGGGKAGIVAEPGTSAEEHTAIVRDFAHLIGRYRDIYVPGPDVGTNDADMMTIAIQNGIDSAVSKPAAMGGNRIDELGAAAGGLIVALERLLEIMPRLTVLPQFAQLKVPSPEELTVIIQGFGAVGAHTAKYLTERFPRAKVTGISDLQGYLYDTAGLPVDKLFSLAKQRGLVTRRYYEEEIASKDYRHPTKFSTDTNKLLRESAFCFIPASPVFNYLGVLPTESCSMSIDQMGRWSVIIEGANTYSPDPNRKAARTRMEQAVYRRKGVMIANDYLVNSGGVIFAAQEHIIPTPVHLQIPDEIRGNPTAVEAWLFGKETEFAEISEKRLNAGIEYRENSIRHNMTELVDLLASNPDLLPGQAAERIGIQRLTEKESERTAKGIMEPIPTISIKASLQEAASLIVESQSNIVAVLTQDGKLAGVLTPWDITRAISEGVCEESVEKIMTVKVISADPSCSILDVVTDLEQNKISAMPVVEDGIVLGMVSSDLLAQQYLLRLLRPQAKSS
ncbi:MAG: Glu/Leu/Phe/Val dehydrogenase dimerization domain-containing protein [Desulfobacterales bacterium]|jgi:glutamate dehydrogenase (NAD(P)+)